jgi:group I intron endonuclease
MKSLHYNIMDQECYIYKITCLTTEKCYIGQTKKYNHKDGKPYNYGVVGRWCDHVSSSKRSDTPLHKAIREYGNTNFKIETIETTTELHADEREAYWINELKTLVPDGFNVMSHSRCKHRDDTSLVDLYLESAKSVKLKTINRDGVPRLVYVYIETDTGKKRLTFGQSVTSSFEEALQEAEEVLEKFRRRKVKIVEKEIPFKDEVLQKVRVVVFNKKMVAVYLKPKIGDQKRVCFGGKTVTFEKALENAREFISRLSYEELEDNLLKSPQQVTTSLAEAIANGEK